MMRFIARNLVITQLISNSGKANYAEEIWTQLPTQRPDSGSQCTSQPQESLRVEVHVLKINLEVRSPSSFWCTPRPRRTTEVNCPSTAYSKTEIAPKDTR